MAAVRKDRESSVVHSFVAFVKDDASANELRLAFRSDAVATDVLVNSGGVDSAVTWLRKTARSPQRLLVDISESSRPLDELDRLADACDPSVEVYVVGSRNDVGLYRNLLVRGVQDYLVKPLSPELVQRVITEKGQAQRRGRYGKCIAVVGTRGGVGATTLAAHLARSLVRGGTRRRVVYLDLNVYDSCGAGMLGRPGGSALLDILGNIDRLDQQYLERALVDAGHGLYVLGAELEYADEFAPHAGALATLLDALCRYFHYVVLDLPHRGGGLVAEALSRARFACLASDPSVHSARTLARLARYVESHPSPPTVITVLNHPQPLSRNRVRDKDFEQATQVPIQVRINYDPKAPALAENLGDELPANCEFARGVRQLTSLVTGEAAAREKGSWWHRRAGAPA